MAVSSLTPFVTNLSAAKMKLAEMQEDLALKNSIQSHSTVEFWRQVPKSKHPELKRPVHNPFLYLA